MSATPFNRHYTDYSLALRCPLGLRPYSDHYCFAAIYWNRDFKDYKDIRTDPTYFADGALYFGGACHIPEVILDVFCQELGVTSQRTRLFQRLADKNRDYLIDKKYFDDSGNFLDTYGSEPAYSTRTAD